MLRRHERWLGEQIGEPHQRVTADGERRDEPDLSFAGDDLMFATTPVLDLLPVVFRLISVN